MLLLLLLLPAIQSFASRLMYTGTESKTEPPKTLTKGIKGCPSEGYFFERQHQNSSHVEDPGPCYLCYCRSDELAVCTLRDDARCDDENRSYRTDVETTSRRPRRRKHRRRLPRSPGLMELFFKDGKNDHILKEMAQINDEDCQPRSSKSIGCPPKNWCTGCLVCDCDDDGIWRCHVMSFCEEQTPRIPTKTMKSDHSLRNILNIAKKTKKSSLVKKKKVLEDKKPTQEKKAEKRSVKLSKNINLPLKNDTKVNKVFKKKSNKTTISTTTNKPVIPLISVKTKTSFLRKDKKDKVIVIKKYISTMSPIQSPELLKYKNDSSKLAQILYQHYEANSNDSKKTKREIKLEDRAGSKAITHNLSKKNKAKYKYYAGNSKTVGDKILNMNPMPIYMKNNVIGRKPVNVKEHHDRNTKMEALKEPRNKRFSFYNVQKEIFETGTASNGKRKSKAESKDVMSRLKKKYKFKLATLANRKKRDVPLMKGDVTEQAYAGNEKEVSVNLSIVPIEQVSTTPTEITSTMENGMVNAPTVTTNREIGSETLEQLFTNKENVPSALNNYAYTIDHMATKNDTGSEITETIKIEAYNLTQEYINTKTDMEITTIKIPKPAIENIDIDMTTIKIPYSVIEDTYTDMKTTKSVTENTHVEITSTKIPSTTIVNTDIDITTTNIPKQANATIDNYEVFSQNIKSSQESTTQVEYIVNGKTNNNEIGNNTAIILISNKTFEKPKNRTKLFNDKDIQKIEHDMSNSRNLMAKYINKVFLKDNYDTNKTGLNTTIEKLIKANDFKAIKKVFFIRELNHTIGGNISPNSKYRPNYEIVLLKYLKNMYSKLLSNKNNKTRLSKNAVMKSICDTFGPCKISSKSVNIINAKITQLVYETKTALNAIKTMKEFLQLLDEGHKTENITEEKKFKSYVTKLNAILTDAYTPKAEREITLINIIKNNTKIFIHSVSKFTIILSDILKIIRSDKAKYNDLKKQRITLKKVIRSKVDSEILHKIKKLFLKFNLLQKKFMHKMYQILSDLEVPSYENDKSKREQSEKRNRMSVKKYMNKINYNLSKLKKITMKMRTKDRKKRFVRDDDNAVEYLLTLIEYLLKVNNPVDSSPVTDGIDVLLQAIKRSPNIKPIRKMNLDDSVTDPLYSPVKEISQSSDSVDEKDENLSYPVNETEILKDDSSLETWINAKEPKPSLSGNKIDDVKTTTPQTIVNMNTQPTMTKYVDVEDMVFNGDQPLNVYIATYPPIRNTEDPFLEEKSNAKRAKKQKTINKPATVKHTNTHAPERNETKSRANKVASNVTKSHFDLLNEEYESRLKLKVSTNKPAKTKVNKKHKKTKRPRVQHRDVKSRLISKTDVSTITKEMEEEITRKRVVAEEADLRNHMTGAEIYDPFKSKADDSISKDVSLNEGLIDEPKSYFSPILDGI